MKQNIIRVLGLILVFLLAVPALAVEKPIVYFTKDISPAGLMAVYNALGREMTGRVAVKLSTGEAGNTHYLSPDLIKNLVQHVNGTIVECNTAYGGSRANTAMHKQVAEDHGFTKIANVDIMDEDGETSLPIASGLQLKEDVVGSHFNNYDSFLVLSHFKGHAMAGFGGAIKNISIGIASSRGKGIIHSAGKGGNIWGADQNEFLESMADAAKAVSDNLGNGEHILYINVMNHLSVDCDCDGSPAAPDMHDIGILGSLDPVALDQACVDLVYAASDGKSLIQRMESKNGVHVLEAAEQIGLGSREYKLVNIQESSSTNKVLVAYFSATNNTKKIAENIAEVMSAELFRIEPEKPYTQADLNYNDPNSRTSKEQNDSSARPRIKNSVSKKLYS